jgi:molecular chaperone GrpE
MPVTKKGKGEGSQAPVTPAALPGAAPQTELPAGAAAPEADLQTQLAAKTREAEEYYDRLLRLAAEMENLKKRLEREKADLLRFANENLIKELLPVVDNLERALEHGRDLKAPPPMLEGLERVHQAFLAALARFGVTPLVSVGQLFDPAFHNAVVQEKAPHVADCTVLKELQKGYLLHDRLLRPAMVVVARNAPESSNQVESMSQEEA